MVAKQAGQFAGGFFNNPGIVAILGILISVAVPLIVFRKQISEFFSQGIQLPDITLPTINLPSLPSLPSFELPSFELPSFEFPDISLPTIELPNLGEIFAGPTTEREGEPIDFTESGMAAARGARGGTDETQEDSFQSQPIDVIQTPNVQSLLETGQQFFGAGPSFIGGFVGPTPFEFLSLNQIIEMGLASSASEAASLRAEAIGFSEEEQAFLMQGPVDVGGFISGGPPAVSDPQFEGLSLTEIALRLTGGPISNF